MAHANVPKFGNWDEDNVPYTVYFDKARKNKGGKMINPNDPQEYPEMFNTDPPLPPPAKPKMKPGEPIRRQDVRPMPEHKVSREDSDFRQFGNSPARSDNMGRGSTNYGGRGQRPARSARSSMGSEQSFERSPLHPRHQAQVMGRGSGSPAWDGRNHDPRSRLRPTREGESPEKGTAVPRFGEWNEKDPQSAENFTHIFNKVKEERNVETGNAFSATPKHPSHATPKHPSQPSDKPKKCCFPWW